MKKGTKPLMVALRREDRGIKEDPQFSPYLRGERYIVFFDYNHPKDLGNRGFRTKREAEAWIACERSKHRPGDPGTNVLGQAFACDGAQHVYAIHRPDPCLAAVNFGVQVKTGS